MAFSPKTVTLYSVGLLGGSIGSALRKSGYKGKIIGLSSPSSIKTALELGCIDEGYGYDALTEVIQQTDLLILCSPILAIIETIEKLGKCQLPPNLTITDVGSTKSEIQQKAEAILPSQVHFIGGHPMAGSEKSGPAASDPYLFQNALYVFTPPQGEPEQRDQDVAQFFHHYLGCRYVFLKPAVHDLIAASVSHLPHILASALVLTTKDMDEQTPGTIDLAAGGFRDITRVASAPYTMWHDILVTNKKPVSSLIDTFINKLKKLKGELENDSLRESFETARETRDKIPFSNKGIIGRLSEIMVMAKDKPGFIASISCELAKNDINIKDIEVLKVREGEGGTIRLAFDSDQTAQNAMKLLVEKGFSVRERK
ncbi:prephenate dehydrogenase [Chitinispirillales bacterium ANBcel5]|uniref:prephenate dehydrogenase/arogenate dehydrogenase family protein n=1 Tax=Cellulosispirillum alkaliphilum TaxID=3039283 RepID=UPI002A50BB73|nr:prephenate dehydrogenase [Chitinispirillales bacterium ANBcel5]